MYWFSCYDYNKGVQCVVLKPNGKCPDFAISLYCNCTAGPRSVVTTTTQAMTTPTSTTQSQTTATTTTRPVMTTLTSLSTTDSQTTATTQAGPAITTTLSRLSDPSTPVPITQSTTLVTPIYTSSFVQPEQVTRSTVGNSNPSSLEQTRQLTGKYNIQHKFLNVFVSVLYVSASEILGPIDEMTSLSSMTSK